MLDEGSRQAVWQEFMEQGHCPGALTKAQLRAAVDAVDDWVDANASAFNTALPQPFRGAATSAQKAIVLAFVALRRAGVL